MRDGAFRSSVIFRPIAFRRHQHAFAAPVAPKLAQETPNWWPLKSAADHFEVFRRSCFSTLENQSLTCRQSENLSTAISGEMIKCLLLFTMQSIAIVIQYHNTPDAHSRPKIFSSRDFKHRAVHVQR